MAETKTRPTEASVEAYLASRVSGQQRADCDALMALLHRVTGEPPVMWGPSIVGYGVYRYTYDSGHSGEAPVVGFAVRGRELVVYVTTASDEQRALLAELGTYRTGKSCLYVKRLADVDVGVLERVIAGSIAEVRRRYG
jgi:hypothetical protein